MKYCCGTLKELSVGDGCIYPPEKDPEIYPESQIWELGWYYDGCLQLEEIFYCPFCGKELSSQSQ